MVTDWNPLTIWIYEDNYVRLAACEYDPTSNDRKHHLTNNCVVKKILAADYGDEDDDDYGDEDESDDEQGFDNIMSMSSLAKHI